MNKVNLKQGTLKWEKARETRIGSSEIFDIVRYYATDDELQNCGINAEDFKAEKPYTTAWALYHKILNDGIFQRQELPPELAEYGHAVESYGVFILSQGRSKKLKAGPVYMSDKLIASLDIVGISEDIDQRPFDFGYGLVPKNKMFVCEQKSMMPSVIKKGLPFKYIIQAQYQITQTKADFYILQLMVLHNDTVFERGKVFQMSKAKRKEYLKDKMTVSHFYFQNNEHLSALINVCIDRFFTDVKNLKEPTPYIENDSVRNIIESIRINTFYNKNLALPLELMDYVVAKSVEEQAIKGRKDILQKIIEQAKEFNVSRFISSDGISASFSADGKFLLKMPKE